MPQFACLDKPLSQRFCRNILLAPRLLAILPALGRGVDEGVGERFRESEGHGDAALGGWS
jgi:hypothetical protein